MKKTLMRDKTTAILLIAIFMMSTFAFMVNAGSGIGFYTVGDSLAEYSTEQAYSGSHSAKLSVVDGGSDWAEFSIPVDIALQDLDTLTFWKMVVEGYCGWSKLYPCGWNPNIILAIDADDDGDFDGDLSGFHFTGNVGSDAFLEGEFPTGLTMYDTNFVLVDAITQMAWWGADVGGWLSGPYAPLNQKGGYQDTTYGTVDPSDRVKSITIVLGGAGSWMDETAFVDDVTINDVTYDLTPPPEPAPEQKRPGKVHYEVGLASYNYFMIPHKLLVFYPDELPFEEYSGINVTIYNENLRELFQKTYWVFPRHQYVAIYFPESLFTDTYSVSVVSDLGHVPYLVASRQGIEINAK